MPYSKQEGLVGGNPQASGLAQARETSRRDRRILAAVLGPTRGLACRAVLLLVALLPLASAAQVIQGRFTHRIPIKIPKGTHGMEPNLALVYDSANGNGILGMGWSLAGLSSISRCNYGIGINYDGTDSYCHTDLGVLVRQPDGSYRSKKESFTKFVPSGTCGDGPCSWIAYDRTGLQLWYGTTSDSELLAQPLASVRRWALAKVVDLFGNSYEATYINTDGQLYPSRITYTVGPSLNTYRVIAFQYEGRTDTNPNYAQGSHAATSSRLAWIIVSSGCGDSSCADGTLIRKYGLTYEYGTSTGRSHLTTVQEYGSDGASTLPAQTFTWQHGERAFDSQPWLEGEDFRPVPTNDHWLQGDFNGDGKMDIARIFHDDGQISIDVYLSTGSSFTSQRWETRQGDYLDKGVFKVGDFNGDGKMDIAYVFNSHDAISIDIHESTGSSFTRQRWETREGAYLDQGEFEAGDFTGDGKTDIAYVFNSDDKISIDVHESTGSSFTRRRWETREGGWLEGGTFRLGDFNGDGKMDIAYIFGHNNNISLDVHASTGSSFTFQHWIADQGSEWWVTGHFVAGDFNGDGKTDVAHLFRSDDQISIDVYESTGSSFTLERWATDQGDWRVWQNSFGHWFDVGYFRVGDYNGDGKQDIAYLFPENGNLAIDVHESTGDSFSSKRWVTRTLVGTESDAGMTGDFDGDGRTDIAHIFGTLDNPNINVESNTSPLPDLLSSVNNGLGGTVGVAYGLAVNAIAPASTAPGIPNSEPRPLVTRLNTTDGRGGRCATSYSYHDGRIWPGFLPDRRDLGFATVQSVEDQTKQLSVTMYNQSPGLEGHPSEVDHFDSASRPISKTAYVYDLVNPGAGTELVRERQRVVTTFEPMSTSSYSSSRTTTTDYDDYANVTVSTQSADGLPDVTVTTTYDPPANWILGRVKDVKTASGGAILKETQYTWDANSITEKKDWLDTSGSWLTTVMKYDTNGNLTSVTEPSAADGLLRKTSLQYDPTYNAYPFLLTDALGQTSSMSYWPDGQMQSVTDPNGNVVHFDYDIFGRMKTETRPDGGTTSYTYDSWGDPNAQRNRMCRTLNPSQTTCTDRYFDGAGFAYLQTSSGTGAQPISVTNCKDVAWRPSASSVPYFGTTPQNCGDTSSSWTAVTYDGASRVSSATKPDGTVTRLSYGPNPGGAPACPAAHAICAQDPNGQVTVRTLDAREKVTSVVDAAGQTTSYGYDPLSRLTSVNLPNGQVFSVSYDSLSRKTTTTDSRLETTTRGYDADGNLTSLVSAGKTVAMVYDALDRLVRKQAGDEPAVTYTYDEPEFANSKGRLTTVVDQAGTTHFAYAATGFLNNFARTIDGADYSQYFSYDWGGRITRVTYPDHTSHADYMYTNEGNLATVALNDAMLGTWSNYTASGRPRNVQFGNGVATTYGYDAVNHLTSLATSNGNTVLQDLSYDWYGRPNTGGLNLGSITDNRQDKVAPDGSVTDETQTYTYDPLYRLTQATGAWGATTPNTYVQKTYEYDAIGNPRSFGGVTDRTLTFNGQQVDTVTGLDGVAWSYTWTTENRLASATKEGVLTARMTYDFSGDRVKKVYTPGAGPTVTTTYIGKMYEKRTYSDGSPDRNTVYVFANGQLLASVTTSGSVATALRNANRWKSEMAATTMYSWRCARGVSQKARHFLKALSLHPLAVSWILFALYGLFAGVVVLVYLAAPGTRASTMGGLAPLMRPVSLAVVLLLTFTGCGGPDHGGLAAPRNYLLAGDTTKGPAIGAYFYHHNHINSNSVVTDSSGNEVTRLVYLPFGELSRSNSSGSDIVTSKFTGQEFDEEMGLYYYGARYYDPKIGRFLSADSMVPDLGDPQSFNRYSYAGNNPVRYVDPSGHQVEDSGEWDDSDTTDAGGGSDSGDWSDAGGDSGEYMGRFDVETDSGRYTADVYGTIMPAPDQQPWSDTPRIVGGLPANYSPPFDYSLAFYNTTRIAPVDVNGAAGSGTAGDGLGGTLGTEGAGASSLAPLQPALGGGYGTKMGGVASSVLNMAAGGAWTEAAGVGTSAAVALGTEAAIRFTNHTAWDARHWLSLGVQVGAAIGLAVAAAFLPATGLALVGFALLSGVVSVGAYALSAWVTDEKVTLGGAAVSFVGGVLAPLGAGAVGAAGKAAVFAPIGQGTLISVDALWGASVGLATSAAGTRF